MKEPIGIIGGLSPYSTILYYKLIVEYFREKAGRDPRIIIYSIPIQEMCKAVQEEDYKKAKQLLQNAVNVLINSGSKIILLAANTPHSLLDDEIINSQHDVEFIDIREAVTRKIRELSVSRIGLLATRVTINSKLYHDHLAKWGIEVITPSEYNQDTLDSLVDSLTIGMIPESANMKLASIISEMISNGAQAILYGCTELSLLVGKIKIPIPLIDSLTEHVKYAVMRALNS